MILFVIVVDRVYPMPVKPASNISSWAGWPDDVRDTIRAWNRERGLVFARCTVFKCADCEVFCEAHPCGAVLFRPDEWLCDDCLIARVRESLTVAS